MVIELIKIINRVGTDFNTIFQNVDSRGRGPWDMPLFPRTLLDIAVSKCDLRVIKDLLNYGAKLSVDTLTAAVNSSSLGVVALLI